MASSLSDFSAMNLLHESSHLNLFPNYPLCQAISQAPHELNTKQNQIIRRTKTGCRKSLFVLSTYKQFNIALYPCNPRETMTLLDLPQHSILFPSLQNRHNYIWNLLLIKSPLLWVTLIIHSKFALVLNHPTFFIYLNLDNN